MAWPLGSNSRASSSGLRPARTRSTICRRNSGEYGGRVLGIGSTSGERLSVSTKPGQSQSHIYMRRFVLGWKKLGLERSLGTRLVTYADDLVILCRRGNAEASLHRLREIMGKLKLTVN